MAEIVITIVGNGLDSATENRALQLAKETGVEGLSLDRLHPGHAVDILVKADAPALLPLLRQKLGALGAFDVFVQPHDAFRKKKLLVADMDATIVQQETLDELAAHMNLQDKIVGKSTLPRRFACASGC
jgi:phosphoserine phosphatase